MVNFEPKIIGLFCRWCTSAGADLAGVSRMEYPPNVLPVQVNCSGRMDPLLVLRAFEAGADGVLIGGCHIGDCHYIDGNVKAWKRFGFLTKILKEMGLAERFRTEHISASEAQKFKQTVISFTETIKGLGPSPIGQNKSLVKIDWSQDRRKKGAIRDILLSLAESVDYEPKKSFEILAEEVMEGYGAPKRDPDKCVLCFACSTCCPEEVIVVEDVQNKRVYGTLSHNCMYCKKCEEICPQEAIKVVPSFEMFSFFKGIPVKDLEGELQQCEDCGQYFASPKHIELVKSKSQTKITPSQVWKLCPSCRQQRIAGELKQAAALQAGIYIQNKKE